jgi:hypothetical protein
VFAETLESAWKREVNAERVFSVTADGWKSRSNTHFIGITAHYINPDWQFMSLPLDLVPLAQTSNVRMSDIIRDCLERRHIPIENIASVCTDGGGDIQRIGEHLGLPHLYCVLHMIHLTVEFALGQPPFSDALDKVKRIVCHVRASPRLEDALKQCQFSRHDGELKPLKLKMFKDQRWG